MAWMAWILTAMVLLTLIGAYGTARPDARTEASDVVWMVFLGAAWSVWLVV